MNSVNIKKRLQNTEFTLTRNQLPVATITQGDCYPFMNKAWVCWVKANQYCISERNTVKWRVHMSLSLFTDKCMMKPVGNCCVHTYDFHKIRIVQHNHHQVKDWKSSELPWMGEDNVGFCYCSCIRRGVSQFLLSLQHIHKFQNGGKEVDSTNIFFLHFVVPPQEPMHRVYS